MKQLLKLIIAIPLMVFGELAATVVFMTLLFGGILGIGVFVGYHVSYVLATILAIGWGILILRLRDRFDAWFD